LLLRVNQSLSLAPFEEIPPRHRVAVEWRAGGGTTRRIVLPSPIASWIGSLEGVTDATEACRQTVGGWSSNQLGSLLTDYLLPNGLIVDEDAPRVLVAEPPPRTTLLWWRRQLLGSTTVTEVAHAASWLFSRPGLIAGALIIGLAQAWLVFAVWSSGWTALRIGTVGEFSFLVALTFSSAVVHEFGHAAALTRSGRRCDGIGIGMYAWYPVLYADVGQAWLLPRRRRMAVNAGGMYFQLLFAAIVWIAGQGIPSGAVMVGTLWIDMLVVRSLNPFLRMDGFWLLSDWYGSTGLEAEGVTAARRIGRAMLNRTERRISISRRERLLAAYLIISIAVLVALGVVMSTGAISQVASAVSNTRWQVANGSTFAAVEAASRLGISTVWALVVGLTVVMTGRIIAERVRQVLA